MNSGDIVESRRNSTKRAKVVEDVVKLEKKIFPKHESLARFFDQELRKQNSGLFFLDLHGEVVVKKCRRQGHGETLLKAAIEKCRTRNIQRIGLHVDPSMTAAMNLYKKLGFQVDSSIEGYYPGDRDAYRMYLEF
ncbi:putative ribosomal-protein-alanine acetyltransferase [Cucumis melo var. makuwa]|uniref:Ribosomal-protein-alanine acetyltransferase n=1 Tax=Cucumis melo var. makuwa TaxID=1194695 RepID=A0A5A7V555_CUCMM|nr:putative ribosomal-protein-alanine acetyltransferase [Cucumis melo var. makuwa]TYK04943.1 putative ribosomal-protein-alanine acetyltransferase [Cucumis melo var. makuwa]